MPTERRAASPTPTANNPNEGKVTANVLFVCFCCMAKQHIPVIFFIRVFFCFFF